jgi:MoaA/NifB/PqqE/SkfB family radical SAM enzyme
MALSDHMNYIKRLIGIKNYFKSNNMEINVLNEKIYDKTSYFERLSFIKKINRDLCKLIPLFYKDNLYFMPSWIIFTISHKCNLQCPHCWTHGTKELFQKYNFIEDMNIESILPKIDKTLPAVSYYSLTMTGEPLLIRNFNKIIRTFGKYGMKLNLVTNGTLLKSDNILDIIANTSNITISIDGAKKASFERLRKGASYEQVIENIGMLIDSISQYNGDKPIVTISFTLMGSNIDDIEELVKLASKFDIKYVQLLPIQLNRDQKFIGEDLSYHRSHLIKKLNSAKELAVEKGINLYVPDLTRIQEKMFPYEDISKFMIIQSPDSSTCNEPEKSQRTRRLRKFPEVGTANNMQIVDDFLHVSSLYAEMIQYANKILEKLNNKEQLIDLNKEHFYCESLQTRIYINNYGSIAPCCIDGRPELGNMFEEPLNVLWRNHAFSNFRNAFFSNSPPSCCRDCVFRQKLRAKDLLAGTECLNHFNNTGSSLLLPQFH